MALKEFQDLCSDNIVLIAEDNTTAVACINKEGGISSGSYVCPSVENPVLVLLETLDSQGLKHSRLNVVVDKLSRLDRIIQTEWSLLPEVVKLIYTRWHYPQIDLFAMRLKSKLPQFVSPVPDSLAWAVDALILPWKVLNSYTFPPVAILVNVMVKFKGLSCAGESF